LALASHLGSDARALGGGVVYSIDGSGQLRAMTQDLSAAVAEARLPWRVEPVSWSHGAGRIFADLHEQAHHRSKGRELAGLMQARRGDGQADTVFIVSHSAGCAVALAAAEDMRPDSIERIILLAPAVSSTYDLKPALRASRQGIDVFYSRKDLISMSLALVGTADNRHSSSAGMSGFSVTANEADHALYAKLRQINWNSSMNRSGSLGGHFGFTRPGFFQGYVVPLLQTPAPTRESSDLWPSTPRISD
jgi:pimeloyl-ACP methyl ester carboxylesterase